jgi:hypothetical protein
MCDRFGQLPAGNLLQAQPPEQDIDMQHNAAQIQTKRIGIDLSLRTLGL